MKPGSSPLPNGRASSAISAEAVAASKESGMKSLMVAVCEPVDLRGRRGDLAPDVRLCFELRLGGTGMELFF